MSQIQKFQKKFKERVQEVVSHIPKGKVLTYGQIATMAGAKGASRAVGTIMSRNTDKSIPCHRVVRSDGKVGDYNGIRGKVSGKNAKQKLLEKEGVKFTKAGKIIFAN